jgi:hypothetical protein
VASTQRTPDVTVRRSGDLEPFELTSFTFRAPQADRTAVRAAMDSIAQADHAALLVGIPAEFEEGVTASVAATIRQIVAAQQVRTTMEQAPTVLPAPLLAALADREAHWRSIADRYGLLTSEQVGQLAGSHARNTSEYASNLRRRNKALAVQRGGRWLYPGFQFTPDGEVYPAVPRVITSMTSQGWDHGSIVRWMDSPNGYLGGATPIERIADTDAVSDAAANAAAQ